MSRLIDADALIEVIKESIPLNWTDSESELQEDADYNHFIEMVKEQPTAYDIVALQAMEELLQYKDVEEQGLLLRLPCKLKTTVYWICGGKIRDVVVFGFKTSGSRIFMLDYSGYDFGIMGVDTFLTVEEAERALAEMQKG